MKKYLQVMIVTGVLGVLIFLKQNKVSVASSIVSNSINSQANAGQSLQTNYKDGTFTGSIQDANYGNLQVQTVIKNGKITDIIFLQYPNDNNTSISINSQAMDMLKQEAISAQSANVSGVSGASFTTPAFIASLQDALNQAK